jgi:hypothetical protein
MGILIGSFHFHGDVQPIALSPPTPRGIDVQGHWQSEDGRCLVTLLWKWILLAGHACSRFPATVSGTCWL